MRNIKLILLLFICIVIANCGTAPTTPAVPEKSEDEKREEVMSSWMGANKQTLIMQWGPPSSVTSDGGKGEILVYEDVRRGTIYGRMITVVHQTMFYVDQNGIIYHWFYKRDGREGDFIRRGRICGWWECKM